MDPRDISIRFEIFTLHNYFLLFKVTYSNLRSSRAYRRCQRKLLREKIYNKIFVVSKLHRESKLLYNNVKVNLNLINFHYVLNISLISISNEKELGLVKFRHLLKLKSLIPNFIWDLVATSSHDPGKVIFNNFSSYELTSSATDLLSKGLHFAIPPKEIVHSNFILT